MMFWYGDGMSGWGYVLMIVGMVGFWALVIFAIVALIRALGSGSEPAVPPSPTARDVLAMRFARGEIDEHEYRRSLEALQGNAPSRPNPPPS
ncbi:MULTISPECIES: SHOCT domain-containing protein [Rhodococcus]|uniref:SHOCT domain-containing protein n=1 Tax=Rhodococcus TaxID=1827 RepID=UPI000C9C78FD|nr:MULTISPECIES: hypothetical protein [Rhodococcus]PND52779.1 hypothetical protein CQZ88_06865 [Rhodococcus sp. ENV425]WKX01816.1 SHOCT domain-containing protein [Rhodococcus aetherivorans]